MVRSSVTLHKTFLLDVENGAIHLPEDVKKGDRIVLVFSPHYKEWVETMHVKADQIGAFTILRQIDLPGPDAADRVLCWEFGRLATMFPADHFIIVSSDKGFAALIDHAQSLRISCEQRPIQSLVRSAENGNSARRGCLRAQSVSYRGINVNDVDKTVCWKVWVRLCKSGCPRTLDGLYNAIDSNLGHGAPGMVVSKIISMLVDLGFISICGEQVVPQVEGGSVLQINKPR
ncbi:MAG: hypothetical protein KatS3mg110_1136 [Pirellulaceae bacterium]|nr:MAG: hypothetical protein KatS3mg110_1136 [Pirellulaceae bacterium]